MPAAKLSAFFTDNICFAKQLLCAILNLKLQIANLGLPMGSLYMILGLKNGDAALSHISVQNARRLLLILVSINGFPRKAVLFSTECPCCQASAKGGNTIDY